MVRDVVALRLARVGDDRVVVGRGDGAHAVAEGAREEVVPGRVPVVRLRRVAVEELLKGVRVAGGVVCDGGEVGFAVWAEPAGIIVAEALLCGCFRLEEVAPDIEDLLEDGVDVGVEEEREAAGGATGPVECSTYGDADHADALCLVGPGWAGGDEVVEELEQVVVIADLHLTGGVVEVRLLIGDLLEHGGDEAEDARVRLNELLELFEHGVEGLWVLADVVDDALEPFFVHAVVTREPVANSGRDEEMRG